MGFACNPALLLEGAFDEHGAFGSAPIGNQIGMVEGFVYHKGDLVMLQQKGIKQAARYAVVSAFF